MGDDDRQIKYIKVWFNFLSPGNENSWTVSFLQVGMDFTQMVTNRILENLEGEEKEEQLNQMRR